MKGQIVLMYHALYEGEQEWNALAEEDRPYAVSCATFERQLDILLAEKIPVMAPRQAATNGSVNDREVLITFDDGHHSGFTHALPRLRERGMAAIFFVTTDFIGQRPGFSSWSDLAEMTRLGMSIQSHGKTHKFIADLTPAEAQDELRISKLTLEDRLSAPVESISFPGGRYQPRDVALAAALGYRRCFTSEVGLNTDGQPARRGGFRRFPIRHEMSDSAFRRIVTARWLAIRQRQMAYWAKVGIKLLFGNQLYHVIYRKLSS